jgi:hypothetical protein
MKLKWLFCIILVTLPVFQSQPPLLAANLSQIDFIINKNVLDEQDKQEIDRYVRDTLQSLLNERNLANLGRYIQALVARKGDKPQYVQTFNDSIEKHVSESFTSAMSLRPAKRQKAVTANLLILLDKLENVRFAILALNQLENENVVVRYWAVQCLTNPEVISQLNAGDAPNPNLAQEIAAKFKNIVPKSRPEILNLMARYAAAIDIPQGQELLLQIADQRIKSYADNTVTEEFIDTTILKLLDNKISNPSRDPDVPALAQRFAQLYSYVIQKYVKERDVIGEVRKNQLLTVIVEIEDKCIKNLAGTQTEMRKAIEQDQMATLMSEHDKLLGSDTTEGLLPAKYHFNYGKTEAGSTRTSPLTLSNPA